MFIFTGHRPILDKLLNTEDEYNQINRSGANEALILADR
jgi:hypothetical protein